MVLAAIGLSVPAVAQDTTIKTKKQAEILVPRISREAVQSMDLNRAEALDTIDTADPHIKILLLSDYTWKYYKDSTYARDHKIFNEYWTHDYRTLTMSLWKSFRMRSRFG